MDTLGDIRDNLKDDLGLGQKDWLTNDELNAYIRRAVRNVHADILTMYEDYFLDFSTVEVAGNSSFIEYPENCYANKIRTVVFTNAPVGSAGSYTTKITSFKDITKTEEYNILIDTPTSSPVRYWIPHSSTKTVGEVKSPVRQMKLVPSAIVDDGHAVIWYIRKPIHLENDEDVCDIPEFTDYVLALAKKLYYAQDGDANYAIADKEAKEYKKLMQRTLSNMALDENTEMLQDNDFYNSSIA